MFARLLAFWTCLLCGVASVSAANVTFRFDDAALQGGIYGLKLEPVNFVWVSGTTVITGEAITRSSKTSPVIITNLVGSANTNVGNYKVTITGRLPSIFYIHVGTTDDEAANLIVAAPGQSSAWASGMFIGKTGGTGTSNVFIRPRIYQSTGPTNGTAGSLSNAVWTLTNTVTGEGEWRAIAAGGGGGAGATNAISTVSTNGTNAIVGATGLDFTNSADINFNVNSNATTTARVSATLARPVQAGSQALTNLSNTASNNVDYVNAQIALTNLASGKQSGSFILTNLIAMGITNIVTVNGGNQGIGTNSGVLFITNVVYHATNTALAAWQLYSTNLIANLASNLVRVLGNSDFTVSLTSTNGTNFYALTITSSTGSGALVRSNAPVIFDLTITNTVTNFAMTVVSSSSVVSNKDTGFWAIWDLQSSGSQIATVTDASNARAQAETYADGLFANAQPLDADLTALAQTGSNNNAYATWAATVNGTNAVNALNTPQFKNLTNLPSYAFTNLSVVNYANLPSFAFTNATIVNLANLASYAFTNPITVVTQLFATIPAGAFFPAVASTSEGGTAEATAGTNTSSTVRRDIWRFDDATNGAVGIALSLGKNFAGLIWCRPKWTSTNSILNGNTNVIFELSVAPRGSNDALSAYIYQTNLTARFYPNSSNSLQIASMPLVTVTNWAVLNEFDFRLRRLGTNVGFARTNGLIDFLGMDVYITSTNPVVSAVAP